MLLSGLLGRYLAAGIEKALDLLRRIDLLSEISTALI